MDSTEVCLNCGSSFPRSEGHICTQNDENVNYQLDDSEDSISIWLKHYCNDEENPNSAPNEGSIIEENQEDLFEGNRRLGENSENVLAFLPTDSLYSEEAGTIVSEHGNPIDGFLFAPLFRNYSSDSYQKKDMIIKSTDACRRQSTSTDSVKAVPDLGLIQPNIDETASESDRGNLNLSSILGSNEQQSASKEASASGSQVEPSQLDHSGYLGTESQNRATIPFNEDSDDLPSCSHVEPSQLDLSGYLGTESQNRASIPIDKVSNEDLIDLPGCSYFEPSQLDHSGYSGTESKYVVLKQLLESKFPCVLCAKPFSSEENRADHMKEHQTKIEKPRIPLPRRRQVPTSGLDSSRHSRAADKKSPSKKSPEKSINCNQCGRTLSYKWNYEVHMKLHSNQKPFACKECGEGFDSEPCLKTHFRNSAGEKGYKCCICGKTFGFMNALEAHFNVHSREKPFKCKWCDRAFSQQSSCNRHSRRHTK